MKARAIHTLHPAPNLHEVFSRFMYAVPQLHESVLAVIMGDAKSDVRDPTELAQNEGVTEVSIISWGGGSAPSIPSIDDESEHVSRFCSRTLQYSFCTITYDSSDRATPTQQSGGSVTCPCLCIRHKNKPDVRYRSSTVSLRSSIYEPIEENGRTYHRFERGSKFPSIFIEAVRWSDAP